VSVESVMARIAAINTALVPPIASAAATTAAQPTAGAAPSGSFAALLETATLGAPSSGGGGIVATAQGEVGQVEQPPGSNDSARIAQYRTAVPGGGVGPWCAYFVSWVAQQNGTPLGENGQGFARVDDVYAWAQRTGRAVPNGVGAQPQPGDLIIWDEHMGIVESVGPDGAIRTIEGNSSDSVAQRTYGRDGGGAVGYVRMS
jgi:hypothetical protein